MTNNFTRTNVDVQTLEVSAPNRSGFDLSVNDQFSIPFGKLFPVRITKVIPGTTFKGSVNPDLQLEKFATPAAGRMRLDTHTFVVPARRIHNGYRQYYESILHGGTAQSLPSFSIIDLQDKLLYNMFGTTFSGVYTGYNAGYKAQLTTPQKFWQAIVTSYISALNTLIAGSTDVGNLKDYYQNEVERLKFYNANMPVDVKFGDVIYNILLPFCGEGSVLDSLGYDIMTYYGSQREDMNAADSAYQATITGGITTAAQVATYAAQLVNNSTILKSYDYSSNAWQTRDSACFPDQCEMDLRANYAVWFDYFRNYHLEPETNVLNPDDFGSANLIKGSSSLTTLWQLLVTRKRNWSRDAFTMVQPDDVYRHVYAPAASETADSNLLTTWDTSFDNIFKDITLAMPNNILDGSIQFTQVFPSSVFSIFPNSNQNTMSTYYHDLQTMRRANMLESYLKRNYYNPDTYVGQIEARYGIKPSDFSILTAQYLGGNEVMIKGDQIVSNNQVNSNDVTPVGQRTLMANASSNDSFAYTTTDQSYIISYVSIVPLIHYNKRNMSLHELTPHDEVIPEFANDNRIIIRACDMLRDLNNEGYQQMLGYVPRYYGYRKALDGVHGKYLREYRSYTWLRDKVSTGTAMLTKSAVNEHINIPLDCFQGLKPWDTVAFGSIELPLFVECALPAKLEFV